jgi:putative redox protein
LLLSHVAVDVTHDRVHAQDAATPGTPIDRFTRRIRLEGDLDRAQRDKLLEIAGKCPVHKMLERGAQVVTDLAPEEEAATP